MKIKILIFLQLLYFPLFAQNLNAYQHLKQEWSKNFASAKDIIETYHNNTKRTNTAAFTTINNCFMTLKSGEYIICSKGEKEDIQLLLQEISPIVLNDSSVITFMQQNSPEEFTNYYYMILALKEGESFDAARDGITISTQFPTRALNHNVYNDDFAFKITECVDVPIRIL